MVMKTIKITWSDGTTTTTKINGTDAEIKKYYIGQLFNHGVIDDCMVRAVNVEFVVMD